MATAAKSKVEQAATVDAQERADNLAALERQAELPPDSANLPATLPAGELIANAAADFFTGFGKSAAVLHNFTGTPQEIWAKTARATGPTTKDSEHAVGRAIQLTHFYCHAVTIVDQETGEVYDNMPRIVLVDKSGEAWSFVSRGILDGLRMLLQSFGGILPPQGIEIVVKRQKTRRGFHVFCIEPYDEHVEGK